MDCKDVNCPGRGPPRVLTPLGHDDALHRKSTPRRVPGPEVHARDRGRRSRTYSELLCTVDEWPIFQVLWENGWPIKVSYATRSSRGRSDFSMRKTDLSGRLETTQSDRLKSPMTLASTTASKTTAVVIRDRSARVDLSRLLRSCTNVPLPNWVPPYHAGSLSQSSNRYVVRCMWLDPLLSIVRLSVIACLPSKSVHRMLHYRTGSPRSLPSVVARI